jgi:hypothetical protein
MVFVKALFAIGATLEEVASVPTAGLGPVSTPTKLIYSECINTGILVSEFIHKTSVAAISNSTAVILKTKTLTDVLKINIGTGIVTDADTYSNTIGGIIIKTIAQYLCLLGIERKKTDR